ncbi:hypothetical protein BGZ60DRAFT_395175 [Tricladium varicosporioides]|nr:hypothetical protein BGZ60DRAFT_395175 [Hymenoscyphus varicosporioides]
MLYGLLSRSPVSFDPKRDIPDLSGKVIAITGGNTGIGAELVLRLASHHPAHIYILSRNIQTTTTTIRSIRTFTHNCPPITHIPLDLTSLSSVRSCATALLAQTERLDLLFLNAGIMLPAGGGGLTEDGYEVQFGTNHLGHFLLAKLLLPLLESTAKKPEADVRVITLSSVGMLFVFPHGFDFNTLKSIGSSWFPANLYRYGRSKLANALFTREFQRRYGHTGITCISVHPGIISSGLWKDVFHFAQGWSPGLANFFVGLSKKIPVVGFQSVEEGARNPLWAASARIGGRAGEVEAGEFYTPVGVEGQGTWASRDMELAGRLWEWSEKEVEGYL